MLILLEALQEREVLLGVQHVQLRLLSLLQQLLVPLLLEELQKDLGVLSPLPHGKQPLGARGPRPNRRKRRLHTQHERLQLKTSPKERELFAVKMAALRGRLATTLLAPDALDFSVGGGLMRYSEPRAELPAELQGLTAGQLGLSGSADSSERAQVMVALVLIARGALDAAHDIVGELGCPEATWAHAIIHRREGEAEGEAGLPGYSNARYWFACLGGHTLFPQMQAFAAAHPAAPRARRAWDPAAFVAQCQKSERDGSAEQRDFCSAVQRFELELLFDHCADLLASVEGD